MRFSIFHAGFRTIGNDVNDVTDLVLVEVGRERDLCALASIAQLAVVRPTHHSLLLEIPRERIARTCAKTGGVTHGECCVAGSWFSWSGSKSWISFKSRPVCAEARGAKSSLRQQKLVPTYPHTRNSNSWRTLRTSLFHRQPPWRPAATRRRTPSPSVLSSPLVCTYQSTATERERAPLMSATPVNVGLGILS